MIHISERLANVSDSATLAMSQKSRELQAQGHNIINLSIGQPDFNTPRHIKEAAKKAIDDNYSKYTPVPGLPLIREAVCAKLKRDNKLLFEPSQIVVSNGAKQSIANVLLSLVGLGDEVIVPAPYWVSYIEMVNLAQGTNVVIKAGLQQDFKITPAQLEKAITPRTKVFLFSSPSNPTGSVYSKSELKALADVFAKYPHVIVVSDEIYELINFGGKHESIAQFEEVRDRVVVVNGVSKGYAMTGWRIGYIAGPQWIAGACNKLQGQYTSGACAISQVAAAAALTQTQEPSHKMKEVFLRRRDMVVQMAREIKGMKVNVPKGAFYLFPQVDSYFGTSYEDFRVDDADSLAMYLLQKGGVATVSGAAFGSPECLRFSYAASDEQLVEAMQRIKKALEKLRKI
ncbi:aspartate aminotransferase [Saccharicrinis carchari]|uniref:Aminotransferase n=1 Tax=Saccharicrinis carchari TaxID=1168039 RepID=A0A521BCX3_SACCC|nr:pyridoxal phosphate-dependent aminotransferase [Saccharicrinis carchari]SMO44944.1 aspartate aminotransferase [Saccharicrinis carchari]